jgi:hypothetical protein
VTARERERGQPQLIHGAGAQSRTARMVDGEDIMGLPSPPGSRVGQRWSTCGCRGFTPNPGPAATPDKSGKRTYRWESQLRAGLLVRT